MSVLEHTTPHNSPNGDSTPERMRTLLPPWQLAARSQDGIIALQTRETLADMETPRLSEDAALLRVSRLLRNVAPHDEQGRRSIMSIITWLCGRGTNSNPVNHEDIPHIIPAIAELVGTEGWDDPARAQAELDQSPGLRSPEAEAKALETIYGVRYEAYLDKQAKNGHAAAA